MVRFLVLFPLLACLSTEGVPNDFAESNPDSSSIGKIGYAPTPIVDGGQTEAQSDNRSDASNLDSSDIGVSVPDARIPDTLPDRTPDTMADSGPASCRDPFCPAITEICINPKLMGAKGWDGPDGRSYQCFRCPVASACYSGCQIRGVYCVSECGPACPNWGELR